VRTRWAMAVVAVVGIWAVAGAADLPTELFDYLDATAGAGRRTEQRASPAAVRRVARERADLTHVPPIPGGGVAGPAAAVSDGVQHPRSDGVAGSGRIGSLGSAGRGGHGHWRVDARVGDVPEAATAPERIVAVTPIVFDVLNMVVQVERQLDAWSEHAPMIQDYVRLGLMDAFSTRVAARLLRAVDPFTHRYAHTQPKQLVLGRTTRTVRLFPIRRRC